MLTDTQKKAAGIIPWKQGFGMGMERRGADNESWYDMSVNFNSIPYESDTAIIVTAWQGQLKWLKKVLTNYRLSGKFVILAYDNPFYGWSGRSSAEMIKTMPNPQHYVLAHSVVHKHITYDGDKRNGWFWDVRYAHGIIKQFSNFKYVFCTNGDCMWEKPEGINDLIKLLGDGDFMAGQSNGIIHTASVLYKIDTFNAIFDDMAERMRVPIIGSRSPERMLRAIVKKLGIKEVKAPKQPKDPRDGSIDYYTCFNQDSTWKEYLGYRNLFSEQETAWNDGLEPLSKKYVDNYNNWIYFSGEERETICNYYTTNDRRYIYQWWDRGEDSDYNRLYYPIGHYGDKPIYKEEK